MKPDIVNVTFLSNENLHLLDDAFKSGKIILKKTQMKLKLKHMGILVLLMASLGLKAQIPTTPATKEMIAEDEAFLKKNKTQPGVVETPSGLQYKVVKMGTGKKPLKFSRVTINYTIKLFNGKIIASNGNNTWEHRLDKALYGMEEALKLMPSGSKWTLYMPAKLSKSKFEDPGKGRALMCTLELLAVK